MYNNILIIVCCLFIFSCTLDIAEKITDSAVKETNIIGKTKKTDTNKSEEDNSQFSNSDLEQKINNTIHIVLPDDKKHQYITRSFLNSLELAVFDIQNKSLSFKISNYSNNKELNEIFTEYATPGKIFVGPLTSENTKEIEKYCNKNILIFSFASDRSLASKCIYLFNFFIEDDLRTIFSYLDKDSRVALLYPTNDYGNYVDSIIENYSRKSQSTLVYKISYNSDLSDIRTVIKQLGKYDFRKQELKRQIEILEKRNDEISLASLKKLKKFETIGELDFTHLIISDGNIRILEIAPLLPFYDIDPNKIKFIGTGLWDEKSFFEEPSLQGAIFPGIEIEKRKKFIDDYVDLYYVPPPRTATIMYDVASLINYLIIKHQTIGKIIQILKKENKFSGLDGKFSIENNVVKRDFSILRIQNGEAKLIK